MSEEFSTIIRDLKYAGLKQYEIAQKIGVPRSTISRIANRQVGPRLAVSTADALRRLHIEIENPKSQQK